MKRGLTYQESMLWWRAQAHATNSSELDVAAISPAATMARANIATERITSVRPGMSLPFITFLSPFEFCGCRPSGAVLLGGEGAQSTRLLPRRATLMPSSALGGRRRCRFSGWCRRWHRRRLCGRGITPGLHVEDDQPDRDRQPNPHDNPADLVLDASFEVVCQDYEEHAAAGAIE